MSVGNLTELYSIEQIRCKQCCRLVAADEGHFCSEVTPSQPESMERLGAYTVMGFNQAAGRVACRFCERKFREDRLPKHEAACEFASRKRPVFNIKRRQFPQLDFDEHRTVSSTKRNSHLNRYQHTRWHKQHEDVLNKLRFGRILETLEEQGEDLSAVSPPPDTHEEYIKCPHCFRKFAPAPAERHIPRCKDIIHKPSPPPGLNESCGFLPKIQRPKLHNSFMASHSRVDTSKSPVPPNMRQKKKTNTISDVSVRKVASPTIECPHCSRVFAPRAAERHIPICEKVRNKPKTFKAQDPSSTVKPPVQHSSKDFRQTLTKKTADSCEKCDAPVPEAAVFCMMCGFKQA